MTTRFTAKPESRFGVPGLSSGYTNVSVPDGLTIPPVGIEDVDVALFHLFNEEMTLSVIEKDGIKRVPVIFASGEKWAMIKRGQALHDKQGTLILPLITIGRANIQQLPNEDITGRGINQQTGELVIKRKLNKADRQYQSLINKLLLKNQENVANNPSDPLVLNQISSDRQLGSLANDPTYSDGGLLASSKLDNIWEIITVPSPQFFTAIYEVTIWVQYTAHMNQILEGLMTSFLPQGNAWRLETKKGYWFVATIDGNLFSPENNADDMSNEERIIKYKFNVKVPAYVLASKTPGAPVPLRRYVSSPDVSFGIVGGSGISATDDPFLGSDDPTLPDADGNVKRQDQRRDGTTRLYPGSGLSPHDPALKSISRGFTPDQYRKISGVDRLGNKVTKYVKVKSINRITGETTFSASDLSDLSIVIADD